MSSTLILIPTTTEMRLLQERLVLGPGVDVALCGFGLISAAAQTATLLAMHRPARVCLLGIAGAVERRMQIGQAGVFGSVGCFGIGAGSGENHQSADELGWKQWTMPSGDSIGDVITMDRHAAEPSRFLVSVCSASASTSDVRRYQNRFPDAVAEDMEGYSVAMACRMGDVPLTIIRGISNVAGDRDKTRWRIADALEAAADLAQQYLDGPLAGACRS